MLSKRVLWCASEGISICLFATAIGAPIDIASPTINLVFLVSDGICKAFLKTVRKKRKKHRKSAWSVRSKLYRKEKITYEALIDANISLEEFTLVSNEAEYYQKLKGNIRIKDSERWVIERNKLIEHGKRIGINEMIRQI